MLTVGDLFSGIGGFSLGLERAGMQTRWFSEIDPYASAVLRKHWADVPNHGDIRNVGRGTVEPVDVLCGGFPCQDISNAGKRAGIDGERSGLWAEYARVIGELQPRYVIVENVAALLGRGLERVLGDLAALGFDAEWHCIPASAVGAPHRRDRIWIVAYPGRDGSERRGKLGGLAGPPRSREDAEEERQRIRNAAGDCGADVADADEPRLERWLRAGLRECAGERAIGEGGASISNSTHVWGHDGRRVECAQGGGREGGADYWRVEPNVGRVADGVPSRVDRLRCLGNAIVPQIAEIIGRAILKAHQ